MIYLARPSLYSHVVRLHHTGLPVEGGHRGMRRPKKRSEQFPNKRKIRSKHVPQEELEAAAVRATYAPSPYHCKENGRLRRRIKPATPCPRNFTLQEAGNAIRAAIRARRVSQDWVNGFPRRLWHREGDQWYEASTNAGTAGTYHAYPLEPASLPVGLQYEL